MVWLRIPGQCQPASSRSPSFSLTLSVRPGGRQLKHCTGKGSGLWRERTSGILPVLDAEGAIRGFLNRSDLSHPEPPFHRQAVERDEQEVRNYGHSFSLSSFWGSPILWPELVTELFRHINMTTLALLISWPASVCRWASLSPAADGGRHHWHRQHRRNPSPPSPCCPWPSALGIGTVPTILIVFVYTFTPHSEEYLYRHHERRLPRTWR